MLNKFHKQTNICRGSARIKRTIWMRLFIPIVINSSDEFSFLVKSKDLTWFKCLMVVKTSCLMNKPMNFLMVETK